MSDQPGDGHQRRTRSGDEMRSFVVRMGARDLAAFDETCERSLEPVAGRKVERTDVVRELMAALANDRDLQRRIGRSLGERGLSRGGDISLGL
jgi:hypothetical protein